MNFLLALILVCLSLTSFAEQPKKQAKPEVIYQTVPGFGTRDWNAPAFVREGDTTYQTVPGSGTRDWNAPAYKTDKDGTIYQTVPGYGTRDWNAPSFKTEKK